MYLIKCPISVYLLTFAFYIKKKSNITVNWQAKFHIKSLNPVLCLHFLSSKFHTQRQKEMGWHISIQKRKNILAWRNEPWQAHSLGSSGLGKRVKKLILVSSHTPFVQRAVFCLWFSETWWRDVSLDRITCLLNVLSPWRKDCHVFLYFYLGVCWKLPPTCLE